MLNERILSYLNAQVLFQPENMKRRRIKNERWAGRETADGNEGGRMGDKVGQTFQQIQKYERGEKRIGASWLYQFARTLNAPVVYFFEELPDETCSHVGQLDWGMANQRQEELANSPIARWETLELVRAYSRIEDIAVRQRLFDLTKILAKMAD